MRLVEPAIYKYLTDQGITTKMYIGKADHEPLFPCIIIKRIDTETLHTKDQSAEGENILIQITSASKESLLLANDINDSVNDIINNLENQSVQITPTEALIIRTVFKENDEYMYDKEHGVHMIHTDYEVSI